MINKMLIFFNSRMAAIWLLVGLVAALIASTFLPNELTSTPEEWELLARQSPLYFKAAQSISTPYLVKTPVFIALSFVLFLSTLVCTLTRLQGWLKGNTTEFTQEKAFSFAIEETLPQPADVVENSVLTILVDSGWDCSSDRSNSCPVTAQKGIRLSFWGSIIFHAGLLLCFLAVPISAFTGFSGQLLLTEGVTLALRDVVETSFKKDLTKLPQVGVALENLRGVYAQGKFKVDFGGDLVVSGSKGSKRLSFSVNNPVSYDGTQFSLQQFGFSPRLVVERGGEESFDYFLNLRQVNEGDYFPLEGDNTRLFLLFFPDFIQEGNKIGSKSREPKNPVLLVRIFEGDNPVHQGLIRIGEDTVIGDYRIKVPELKKWATLAVSREHGLTLLIFGMLVGIAGLFVRFMSNERRLVINMVSKNGATIVQLQGYSRYYPAFLEKEVRAVAEKILREELS